jgi:hypothetical protein
MVEQIDSAAEAKLRKPSIFTPSSPISARAFGASSPNQDIRF